MLKRTTLLAALVLIGLSPKANAAEILLDRGPDTGAIWTLAVSPDGSTIATAGHDDGTVRLWNAADGTLKTTLQGHASAVHGLAFSPDGKTLATGGRDRSIKLWTLPEGRELRTLNGEIEMINEKALAFFSDGSTIAAGGGESGKSGVVIIFDAASGDVQNTLAGHSDRVLGVAISRDGKTLASASMDRTIKVWDVPSGRAVATLKGHENAITVVSLSPDGKTLASADMNGQLRLWNTSDWKERAKLSNLGDVRSLAFSPDGRSLALGTVHGLVKFLDPATLRETSRALKHAREVFGLAYLPDGLAIASAGLDGTVRLWPAPGPPAIVTIAADAGPESAGGNPAKLVEVALNDAQKPTQIWSLAMGRDGRRLVTGQGEALRVWDLDGRRQVSHVSLPGKTVRRVDISPDGKLLAAAEYKQSAAGVTENVITIRDVETCKVQRVLSGGHKSGINGVAFSPDGKTLASCGWGENEVKRWDVATGEPKPALAGHTRSVNTMAFSPDGRFLASASQDHTARIWNLATGETKVVLKGHDEMPESVVYSPDGKTIATASFDKTVKLWNASDGTELATLKGHNEPVLALAFHPDGKLLASSSSRWGKGNYGGAPAEIKLWNLETRTEVATLPPQPSHVFSLAFTPDGKTLITGGFDTTLRLWDVDSRKQTAALDPSKPTDQPEGETAPVPLAVAFSPDGRFLATAGEDKLVLVRNVETRELLHTLSGHDDVIAGLAFSPDSKTLASSSYDKTVRLWEMPTGQLRATLKGHKNWAFAVAFSPDGKTLASAGYDKTIRLWNAASGESIGVLEGHTAGVRALAFSPDGKRLATGAGDRTVRLWDLESRQPIHVMKGHKGAVRGVTFSSDGATIASASEDKTIKLWDASSGKERTTLNGHADMVTCLAFAPGRAILASGGWDATLKLWDTLSGRETLTLRAHNDAISALAFAPGGRRLATTGYDRAVKLWEAPLPVLTPSLSRTEAGAEVGLAAFSPDGKTMVWGGGKAGRFFINQPPNGPSRTVEIESGESWAIAFAPDGQTFAIGQENTIKVFEATSLRLVRELQGHTRMIRSLAFSPDGKTLASGSADRHVMLWNAATGEELPSPPAQPLMVSKVAFLPDGKTLVVATGDWTNEKLPGALTLWDVASAEPKGMFTDYQFGINALAVSPDGQTIATGGGDWLKLLDAATLALKGRLKYEVEPSVHALAFLPDGKTLASGSFKGDVVLWDVASQRQTALLKGHQGKVNALAASSDGRWLASAGLDKTLKLWRTGPRIQITASETVAVSDLPPWSVAYSPDGKTLVMAFGEFNTPGHVALWDIATRKSLVELKGHEKGVASAVFAPDGKTLASGSWDGTIRRWDVATGQELSSWEGGSVTRLAFSPDGKTLASVGENRMLKPWDVETGKLRAELEAGSDRLQCLAFSPDGQFLATGGGPFDEKPQSYGEVRLWAMGDEWTEVGRFDGHANSVLSLRFAPDGKTLLTGSVDHTLRLWDVKTRQPRLVVEGSQAWIEGLAVSPDGQSFVSPGRSLGELILRDLATGEERAQLVGHTGQIRGVAYSPDGKTLASVSTDKSLRLWTLPASK